MGGAWTSLNVPDAFLTYFDMSLLSSDTIWLVSSDGLTGGVFFTPNGGVNWTQRFSAMNNNPSRIYMYNARLGFISTNSNTVLRRTSDGGASWNIIGGENGFGDIKFADSLIGWKAAGLMKKTTNGGLNWVQQILPQGGIITVTGAGKLSVINSDTIWAVGGKVQYPNLQDRGIVYRTTNGGSNWLFQIPDTGIHSNTYFSYVQFINSKCGWAYTQFANLGGIHTTTGGDPVWITGIKQISTEIPKDFKLYQNYPNPFNPSTVIKYQITNNSFVNLNVFDINGKEIETLVNQRQQAGTYEIDFNSKELSSGVYFYSLITDGKVFDTKKMVLVK